MQDINPNYVMVALGIILAVVEVLLGAVAGFELLIIGIIFILSGIVGISLNSISVAIVCVAVFSTVYLFYGRKIVRNKLHIQTADTNIDAIIGKQGVVVKRITDSQPGQVKVSGEIWRASASSNLNEGDTVVVESFSGVTLHVKPFKN